MALPGKRWFAVGHVQPVDVSKMDVLVLASPSLASSHPQPTTDLPVKTIFYSPLVLLASGPRNIKPMKRSLIMGCSKPRQNAYFARLCSVLLFLYAAVPPASAVVFLLDARGGYDSDHNLATGAGFTQFRNEIASKGFQWAPITSFESANLQGADALVLLQPYATAQAYSVSELSALSEFASHKGLLLLADGGTGSSSDYLNPLSSTFGVTFASSASEATGATITGFSPHPLTTGVGAIAVDYQRQLTISSPAYDLTLQGGSANFAAVTGRAIFVSDSSIFMDPYQFSDASIASLDNRVFVQNALLMAAVPEPTALVPAILLLAGALMRFKRSRQGLKID
jgi:hypothetical protein